MFKIDKNIPLPKSRNNYPLGDMEIGDSFFIPGATPARMGSAFANYKPKKFSGRTVTEDGVKGCRVWRVA